MRTIFIGLIRFYQRFLSPLFPAVCRFRPTCSHYTLEAVRRYGAFRGTWLGTLRILRCNPFSEGGWDPVPTNFDILGRHHGHKPPDPLYADVYRAAGRIGMLLSKRTGWKSGRRFGG